MIGSTNRASRRSKAMRRAKTSALAGAAAAAITASLVGAPTAAAAIPVNIDLDPTYTAGTLAGILDFVGNAFPGTSLGGIYNSGPPATVDYRVVFPYTVDLFGVGKIPLVLDVNAGLTLQNIKPSDTQYLYNTLAAIPQQNTGCGGTVTGFGPSNPATSCRFAVMLGTSQATLNLANAYRTQIASVTTGQTPAGYIPFQATVGSTEVLPTQTNQLLVFLQNPLRPNGGFLSRFPGFSEFLGQDPSMPGAGLYKSADGTITINTTTVDATWAYDPTGDFPEVFNIFSILNSLNALLPINLAGGLSATQPFVLADQSGNLAKVDDIGLSLAGLFQVPISPIPVPTVTTYWQKMEPGKAYYATIVPNQLPLFSGMRLPALAINAALGFLNAPFRFGTPLSDALEPAFKILVNIGYDDVVTPDMIAADPVKYGSYQPYDRTFLNSGVVTPFGSVDPLTPEEQSQVVGDVFHALLSGFGAQFAKPFWGIIEPANSPAAPASASRAAVVETPRVPAAEAVAGVAAQVDSPAVQQVAIDPVPSVQEGQDVVSPDTTPAKLPAGSGPTPATTPVAIAEVAAPADAKASARGSRGTVVNRVDAGPRQRAAVAADSDQPVAKAAASAPRQRASR